jgi:hypothetical protein
MVECLLCKSKALSSSISLTGKKRSKKGGREREKGNHKNSGYYYIRPSRRAMSYPVLLLETIEFISITHYN